MDSYSNYDDYSLKIKTCIKENMTAKCHFWVLILYGKCVKCDKKSYCPAFSTHIHKKATAHVCLFLYIMTYMNKRKYQIQLYMDTIYGFHNYHP